MGLKIRLGEIYQVLQSILDVKGYAAVPAGAGNLVKIVPRAEAVNRSLQVRIGGNPSEIPKTDSLVTQIIPLSYADATAAVTCPSRVSSSSRDSRSCSIDGAPFPPSAE